MEKIRVMLADDNLNLLRLLTDYLSRKPDIELVAAVSDGVEIPDAVRQFAPDILVMDIIMPRRDGFMTLEALSAMVKPFDMGRLYERIVEVAREQPPATRTALPGDGPEESVDEQITNLFLTLGIPAHIKGYQYLREAVRMVLENHELINRITKELYPGIARRFDTSASKVERAMRHAIEVAWTRGRLEAVNQMYGYRVFAREDKPTNGEFIAMVSDKLAVKKTA